MIGRFSPPGRPLAALARPLLAVAAAAAVGGATAQAVQGGALFSPVAAGALTDPARLLRPAADVTLTPSAPARLLTVVVTSTESAAQISRRYGVDVAAVRLLASARGTRHAQVSLAPASRERAPLWPRSVQPYRVRAGDTLAGIAARHGMRIVDVLGVNLERRSLDRVQIGEVLHLPTQARGVLIRIKAGQSALSLIAGYGADLAATARANGVLPTDMQIGDALLLPGVTAAGFQQQLLAQRVAEQRAAVAYDQQRRYERFLAQKQAQRRREQVAAVARQVQYERFLAWQQSAERQARIRAYEAQERFEAAQAAARQRAQEAARLAAARSPSPARAEGRATVQRASTGAVRLAWPMRTFRITSRYAERDIEFHRQVFHGGVDLAAPYGTPIYAATDGEVSRSGYGDYGLNVFVESGSSTLVYGHMSRTAVVAGQRVSQGQLLGYVGCSGICTGPHLHFEVRLDGRTVDPLALLP